MQAQNAVDPICYGIHRIINDMGYKKNAIAKRAGFSEQQFSAMLNGRKIIRAEYMPRSAKALDVSVADIYDAGAEEAANAES